MNKEVLSDRWHFNQVLKRNEPKDPGSYLAGREITRELVSCLEAGGAVRTHTFTD